MKQDIWQSWVSAGRAYTLHDGSTAIVISVLSSREPQTVTAGVLCKSSYVANVLQAGELRWIHLSVHWYPPDGEPQLWWAPHTEQMLPTGWGRAHLV